MIREDCSDAPLRYTSHRAHFHQADCRAVFPRRPILASTRAITSTPLAGRKNYWSAYKDGIERLFAEYRNIQSGFETKPLRLKAFRLTFISIAASRPLRGAFNLFCEKDRAHAGSVDRLAGINEFADSVEDGIGIVSSQFGDRRRFAARDDQSFDTVHLACIANLNGPPDRALLLSGSAAATSPCSERTPIVDAMMDHLLSIRSILVFVDSVDSAIRRLWFSSTLSILLFVDSGFRRLCRFCYWSTLLFVDSAICHSVFLILVL